MRRQDLEHVICAASAISGELKRPRGQLITNYVCFGRGRLFGDPSCQNVLGTEVDAAIGKPRTD
jgi:hypothetical protein